MNDLHTLYMLRYDATETSQVLRDRCTEDIGPVIIPGNGAIIVIGDKREPLPIVLRKVNEGGIVDRTRHGEDLTFRGIIQVAGAEIPVIAAGIS
jgi:hypothetical protein